MSSANPPTASINEIPEGNTMNLTPVQKRRLWTLFVKATQGEYGTLYDEDHEFDDVQDAYIKKVEAILNLPADAL